MEAFVKDAIVTQRPVPETLFREKTVVNYPQAALRELCMNASMHRDYQSNMPIRLYQFDDHIEIMNAGGLYGEARPENFPLVNDYRNPIIAEAMKGMKYLNMFNQGVRRVQEWLRKNGNGKAEFDVSMLTAFRVNVLSNEKDDTINDHINDHIKFSDLQLHIIDLVSKDSQTTLEEMATETGKSKKTIQRAITDMEILHFVGPRKGGHWEITD